MPEPRRFRDLDEFSPTIDAAAEQLGISPTAIEKDYWISEALRAMTTQSADDFILKGGTSLSKGYGLVQRFSEDIDILILKNGRGLGAIDKLMKAIAHQTAAAIGGTTEAVGGAERGRHRAYEVHYPALRPATNLIRTAVLLEMGTRGGHEPNETAPIGSLLGDALAGTDTDLTTFADLKPFDLAVLHPGRTLIEKLVLVHAAGQRLSMDPTLQPDPRIGRHFYDINELLSHQPARQLLADRDHFDQILSEIADITEVFFNAEKMDIEIRPQAGFAASPAFDLKADVSTRFKKAYQNTMPDLYYGHDPLPAWNAICERVAQNRELL